MKPENREDIFLAAAWRSAEMPSPFQTTVTAGRFHVISHLFPHHLP